MLEPLGRFDNRDDAPPGSEAVHSGEPRRAACEPDSGQIAAREDRVALHGAGRDDDALRVHEVETSRPASGTSGPW